MTRPSSASTRRARLSGSQYAGLRSEAPEGDFTLPMTVMIDAAGNIPRLASTGGGMGRARREEGWSQRSKRRLENNR